MAKLKVTLKKSLISRPETQRKTVRSLGLRKLNSFSILPDVPTIRGQIFKVKHLVEVQEISDADATISTNNSATKLSVEKKAPDVKKGPAIAEKVIKKSAVKSEEA